VSRSGFFSDCAENCGRVQFSARTAERKARQRAGVGLRAEGCVIEAPRVADRAVRKGVPAPRRMQASRRAEAKPAASSRNITLERVLGSTPMPRNAWDVAIRGARWTLLQPP